MSGNSSNSTLALAVRDGLADLPSSVGLQYLCDAFKQCIDDPALSWSAAVSGVVSVASVANPATAIGILGLGVAMKLHQVRKNKEEARKLEAQLRSQAANDQTMHDILIGIENRSITVGLDELALQDIDQIVSQALQCQADQLDDGLEKRFALQREELEAQSQQAVAQIKEHNQDQQDLTRQIVETDGNRTRELISSLHDSASNSALGIAPARARQHVGLLVERDTTIEWLRQRSLLEGIKGDALIVGQPGTGKTALHQALADAESNIRFVIDHDRNRLENSIRSRSIGLAAVVVDDAHQHLKTVESLVSIRRQTGLIFSIHLNAWPSFESTLRDILELSEEAVHHLEPLNRESAVRVVNAAGIKGPENLMAMILDQSEGKPGLLVELSRAILEGEGENVWTGEVIARRLLDRNEEFRSRNVRVVLASVALAGDAGVRVEDISGVWGLSPIEVSQVLTALGTGGVVHELTRRGDGRADVTVRPKVLRGWLVADVFYTSSASLDISPWIERLDTLGKSGEATSILMHAVQRGALIEEAMLIDRIRASLSPYGGNRELWRHFAFLSHRAADLIFDEADETIIEALPALFHQRPERALRTTLRLLATTENTSTRESCRSAVKDWLQGDEPGDEACLHRRLLSISLATEVLKTDTPVDASDSHLWLIRIALSPNIDASRSGMVKRDTVTIHRGILGIAALRALSERWPEAYRAIPLVEHVPESIRKLVEAWAQPHYHAPNQKLDAASRETLKATAAQMLRDILSCPIVGRATRTWAKRLSRQAKLDVEVPVDQDFDRLFGREDHNEDYETRIKRRSQVFEKLADIVATRPPDDAIADLSEMEAEAEHFDGLGAYDRFQFYFFLGKRIDPPIEWFDAAVSSELPASAFAYLFDGLWVRGFDNPESILNRVCETDRFQFSAVYRILGIPGVSDDLLNKAIAALPIPERDCHNLGWHIAHQRPTVKAISKLLEHENSSIREAAVYAEWNAETTDSVRDEVAERWREVIVSTDSDRDIYQLGQILKTDATLAYDWAKHQVQDRESLGLRFHSDRRSDLWHSVISLLTVDQRHDLLTQLQGDHYDESVVTDLIGESAELMRLWIDRHKPTDHDQYGPTLVPLRQKIDDAWIARATAVLDAGFLPATVASMIGHRSHEAWVGGRSQRHQKIIDRLAPYSEHEHPGIREVVRLGIEESTKKRDDELRSEKEAQARGEWP